MSYHIFNNLAELINRDLTVKIKRGILSQDLFDKECYRCILYKVYLQQVENSVPEQEAMN